MLILLPAFLMHLSKRVKIVEVIGPVLLCYGIGLLLGNLMPGAWPKPLLDDHVNGISVTLAIPLLMFHSNPRAWFRVAGRAVLSFGLGAIAVVIAATCAYELLGDQLPFGPEMSAMMVGVYTGGTPNLVAIGEALEVTSETTSTLIIMDTVLCAVYLLFLLTVAGKFLSIFLPATKVENSEAVIGPEQTSFSVMGVLKPLLLSAGCLGFGLLISQLLWSKDDTVTILLTITLCAFALSFAPVVNKLNLSYQVGEYFILVFCLSIGLLSDLSILKGQDVSILLFCAIIVFGSIGLHYLFAYFFKVDVHTVLITSTAALFGPAFVGLMASRLRNPAIITSGMTTGVIGYVIANFLGLVLYKTLVSW